MSMIEHIHPETLEVRAARPGELPGWVKVTPSACGNWLEMAEGMSYRAIRNPDGPGLLETTNFSALLKADGHLMRLGPVDCEFFPKWQIAERLAEFARACGGELPVLVFHADREALGGPYPLADSAPDDLLDELWWDLFR
jgi:hypothetical protein